MAGIPSHHSPHVAGDPISALVGLFWFFVTVGIAMTGSLLALGGPRIRESAELRTALIAGAVVLAVHFRRQYRHRAELLHDERLRRARERRGF
jgi:hypothetical protein